MVGQPILAAAVFQTAWWRLAFAGKTAFIDVGASSA